MQFTIIIATFLATLATAAPVAVPKTTVVEREAGGFGLDGILKLVPLGGLGGAGGATSQLNSVAPQGKTGGGVGGGLLPF
ncbi:hypothetical protein CKM354_000782300 [Cercospora kikuchii]|uniref:Uncharacterized protein n=1 Tax=Cercospora kikuchii TaxID=84275 RepID=A0A9P3CLR4_9PEZI|nr:uncharacterized protein CKM354_000782300 [Cercospora kikuchii]GIZ44631.1 hypothetical protein CKM354_000782300 [Cercospora kikuchii]